MGARYYSSQTAVIRLDPQLVADLGLLPTEPELLGDGDDDDAPP